MPALTRIKICGITNTGDAAAACEYGADALGFIFVRESPRFVGTGEQARGLLSAVPPLVWRIGVFDAPPTDLGELGGLLHAVQYYQAGDVPPALLPIKAFRIRDEDSLQEVARYSGPRAAMILLDAYSPHALGGTGHTFNWDLAKQAKSLGLPIILAGGLTPENVGEAVAQVRPYGVDVSSGVEAEPGRKDHDRVRRFIRAVREADRLS